MIELYIPGEDKARRATLHILQCVLQVDIFRRPRNQRCGSARLHPAHPASMALQPNVTELDHHVLAEVIAVRRTQLGLPVELIHIGIDYEVHKVCNIEELPTATNLLLQFHQRAEFIKVEVKRVEGLQAQTLDAPVSLLLVLKRLERFVAEGEAII